MNITPEQANALRKDCKEHIERKQLLDRLNANPDFEALVKHYLEEEPARLAQLYGDPAINLTDKRELHREEIHERLIGIARFAEYLRGIHMLASQAEKQLEDLQKAEAEAVSEAEVVE